MQYITGLAEYFRALQGWRAHLAAFGLGVCFTAAFPPFWLLPLAVLAFSGWLWMLQGAETRKTAFARGWWFGFGHHTTGLYWICIALGIDGGTFLWLMPFALCVLPAYLALYTGLVGVFVHMRRNLRPFEQVLWLALLWAVLEYIRAHFIYGFPWNLAGYIWTLSDATLQAASWLGAYGMGVWAVLFCAAFSLLAKPMGADIAKHSRRNGFIALMLVSLLLTGWGAVRLMHADEKVQAASGANIRIVQASVEQSLKWDPQFQIEALQRHINMSKREASAGFEPDYIIWPETAMPYPLEEGSRWVNLLSEIAPQQGELLTGTVRYEGQESNWRVWNSLQAVDSKQQITASYDKHILVPFGEFVPLRAWLGFLPMDKITHGSTDFSQGRGASVIELSGKAPLVQPLICYEAIFPDFRTDDRDQRPDWLLNITNDAWFGVSTGPYQHLHMVRTRAVERGIPLVRAANTGVSVTFDAFGRVLGDIPLNEKNIVDIALPSRTIAPTWYSVHGEATLIIICYILLICTFRRRSKTA